jgi:hypothetical protein
MLTEKEREAAFKLPFSERSLVSMRCHMARAEPQEARDQIIRDAITKQKS